ncbi:MAG: VOC family protein [Comamonadaceae bacterium]|nr:MAG: VOC family protein [Comamonadaceae bacterium]
MAMPMPQDGASPRPVHGLHHFAWRCRDAEETRHFYEDLLGLPLVHVIKNDHVPSTGEYCPYVHIFFRMRDGVNHIALRVADTHDLEAMRQRLLAAGVEVLGVTNHDDYIHSIYFFDPNGFRLELTTEVAPKSEVEGFATTAHDELAQWTREKSAR